ncbi:hypothetical protein [Mesorhizobium sp. M0678]|uniref:hypothetical protein n=1 Tax=Mesorhizobium sp. M0678 TaxID=2956985 RepID=UPI00333C559D
MYDHLTPWEKFRAGREAVETLKGALGLGMVIWLWAAFKIHYLEKLPDSLWDHSGRDNVQNFIDHIARSNLAVLSIAGFVLAGLLFCLMTLFVLSFYLASIVDWWDQLFPKELELEKRPVALFIVKWGVLLPMSAVIWIVLGGGLYQLAKLELWLIYR